MPEPIPGSGSDISDNPLHPLPQDPLNLSAATESTAIEIDESFGNGAESGILVGSLERIHEKTYGSPSIHNSDPKIMTETLEIESS